VRAVSRDRSTSRLRTSYGDEGIGGLDAHLAYEVDAAAAHVYTIPFITEAS
jgi:hypothetical protein